MPLESQCSSYASHVPLDGPIAALLIEPLSDLKGIWIYLCDSMNGMVRLLDTSNVCLSRLISIMPDTGSPDRAIDILVTNLGQLEAREEPRLQSILQVVDRSIAQAGKRHSLNCQAAVSELYTSHSSKEDGEPHLSRCSLEKHRAE
jgi:hypothetical protein